MTHHSPLHILHILRPAAGGMRRHLELLCAGLATRGFALSVAAPPETVIGQNDVHHFDLFSAPITARPHPLHDLRAARIIARHARETDLLHGHGLRGAWIAALAARRARKPFLFTAHNLAPPNPSRLTGALFGYVARRAAAVIAVSQAVADSLAPYGVDAAKITVIPNGIDLTSFNQPQNRETVLSALNVTPSSLHPFIPSSLIAAVGRLAPEKGFSVLIEAAPRVLAQHPDTAFVLAGEGPERTRLESQIRTLGLAERFHLLGHCPDVAALLTAADIVAVPSLSEGQGLVAIEAMAARKPVVASRVGGLRETALEGITGLLVPPGDPDALAWALIQFLQDAVARARMGAAGRARVEERFTLDRMADATAALYRGVKRET